MVNENARPQSLRIVFAKGTDVGRQRGHNEDCVEAFAPPDPAQRRQKGYLFLVADGMGGHQAGEVASRSAVQTVSREYYADPDPDVAAALVHSIQEANALIHRQAQDALARVGMGTTLVAAVARGSELYLANVGDSRAYLLHNGALRQVTRDHSFVEEQVRAGILTREEARGHPQRHVITRALGVKPDVKVDTFRATLAPGDTLLLCTDGLSEPVPDPDLREILGRHRPAEAVPKLIALANQRGGNDNVTALVVRALPVGASAKTQPLPVVPSSESKVQRAPSVPTIVGLAVVGLVLLAAVAAGVLFLAPGLGGVRATATPAAAQQGVTASPLPSATVVRRVESGVTPMPPLGFRFLEPPDQAVVPPGARVNFRWGAIGRLPEPYSFVVRTNHPRYQQLCRMDQESCIVPMAPGEYEWWVEIWSGSAMILESPHRTVTVLGEAGQTPRPATPVTTAPLPTYTAEPP